MMDIGIEANDVVITMLENRIKQLEKIKDDLENEVAQLKSKSSDPCEKEVTSLPRHLAHVRKEHLPKLKGYSLRYLSEGNGARANNSVAVAIHEDEGEGPKVKRRTLDH